MNKKPVYLDGFMQPTKIDFGPRISESTYRADPRLNFHTLLNFRRDPRAFKDGYFEREETDAMRFGTALHARLLTPEEYEKKVAFFEKPVNPKTGEAYGATTKAYAEARREFEQANVGKTLITADEAALIERLIDEFWFHPAAKILKDYESEVAIGGAVSYNGKDAVDVKGRIDAYGSMGLIDVKTTANLDDATGRDRFHYHIYDYKYIVQLAFYHLILTQVYAAPFVPAWLVVFEKNPPNRVAVYAPTREVIEKAYLTVFAWLEHWQVAQKTKRYESPYSMVHILDKYDSMRDITFGGY